MFSVYSFNFSHLIPYPYHKNGENQAACLHPSY